MDLAAKLTWGLATVLGLRLAGKKIPGVKYLTLGGAMVVVIDKAMEKQVCEDVLALNTKPGCPQPNIILCPEFGGLGGLAFLKDVAARRGGTVWFQMSRGRMQCFHHHDRRFQPRKPPVGDYGAGLGHIVHASRNSL